MYHITPTNEIKEVVSRQWGLMELFPLLEQQKILGATFAIILPPGWNRVLVSLTLRQLWDMKEI